MSVTPAATGGTPAHVGGTPAPARVALAAPHTAAVEAGRTVAAAGGNALDAALAAAAALTVVYPHQCSIGGDLIAVVRPAGGRPRAIVSAGAAAKAIHVDGDEMPIFGPLAVTVPGVVAGWAAVADQGARLSWAERLAPAVGLAANGTAVSAGLARAIRNTPMSDPGLSRVFGALREGDLLVQPALAGELTELARDWRTFYTGSRLVAGLQKLGSPLTGEDFAAHEAEVTDPLTIDAYGASWFAAPPPSQGATFLAVVGAEDLVATSLRARRARDRLLGDPRTGKVDLDGLLLRDGEERAGATKGRRPTGDTVAITAVDSDGTAVTLIQSVFYSFGSRLLDPATGIVLHNRGSMFTLDPAHPGRLVPGSRPPHTLCPTIAVTGDDVLALGCQGGLNQPWILAQVAGDALTSADPAEVVARPRWIFDDDVEEVILEPGLTPPSGLPSTTVDALHDDAGHVQLARRTGKGLAAASDPRADGIAAVF